MCQRCDDSVDELLEQIVDEHPEELDRMHVLQGASRRFKDASDEIADEVGVTSDEDVDEDDDPDLLDEDE